MLDEQHLIMNKLFPLIEYVYELNPLYTSKEFNKIFKAIKNKGIPNYKYILKYSSLSGNLHKITETNLKIINRYDYLIIALQTYNMEWIDYLLDCFNLKQKNIQNIFIKLLIEDNIKAVEILKNKCKLTIDIQLFKEHLNIINDDIINNRKSVEWIFLQLSNEDKLTIADYGFLEKLSENAAIICLDIIIKVPICIKTYCSSNLYYLLQFSCEKHYVKLVDKIVDIMKSCNRKEYRYGLIGACKGQHIDLVEKMILLKASDIRTACFISSKLNNSQILKMLIKYEKDTYALIPGTDLVTILKVMHYYYNAYLGDACWRGKIENVRVLLNSGADSHEGIRVACMYGYLEIVKLLVEYSVDKEYMEEGLNIAEQNKYYEIVNYLRDKINAYN